MNGNTLTLVLVAIGLARAMPMPQATPAPSVKPAGPPGIRPEFAITDGKISAGLSIGYVGLMNGPGNSESGLLSLGGDLNTVNLIEGGIEEADTESIEGPLFTREPASKQSRSLYVYVREIEHAPTLYSRRWWYRQWTGRCFRDY